MTDTVKTETGDLVANYQSFLLHWGLPITAMVGTIFLAHPIKTLVWVVALLWMGIACLINARRCGRTHCYYTGPFFLFMTIPVLLHGYQIFWLGPEGWKWLGITTGIGGGGLWWFTEKIIGKYLAKSSSERPIHD